MTGLDFTAAIEAAAQVAAGSFYLYPEPDDPEYEDCSPDVQSLWRINVREVVNAALPHVREALARQIEMEICADTSFATDRVLELAASIVRGQS